MSSPGEARAAMTAALSMHVLGLVGLALDGAYWATGHGGVLPAYLVALGVLAALFVAVLVRRRRPSVALAAATALVNVAVVLTALWYADDILAREMRPWVPFQPHKLGALALAIVAPTPVWVGVTSIVAFTLAPVAHYLVLPAEVRAHLALGEPWGSLAFGAFALVAFFHRIRLLRIEREALRAQAEAVWLSRLAAMSLAVRDLSNTPLQVLQLSSTLLRRRHPEETARLDQIDRALGRLEQLERTLSRYEAGAPSPKGPESFDALAVLEGASARVERGSAARGSRSPSSGVHAHRRPVRRRMR